MTTFGINPKTITAFPILSKELAKTELGMEYIGKVWLNGIDQYDESSRHYRSKGYYKLDIIVESRGKSLPLYSARKVDAYAEIVESKSMLKQSKYETPILTEDEFLEGYVGVSEDELAPYDEAGIERVIDMCEYLSELKRYKKWCRTVLIQERVDLNILLRACLCSAYDTVGIEKLRVLVEKYNTAEMIRVLVTNPQFRCDLDELVTKGGY